MLVWRSLLPVDCPLTALLVVIIMSVENYWDNVPLPSAVGYRLDFDAAVDFVSTVVVTGK